MDGAIVTVNGCTNVNGDMKDIVNYSGASKVVVDKVTYQNVAKIGDTYYKTLADAIAAAQDDDTVVLVYNFAEEQQVRTMRSLGLSAN